MADDLVRTAHRHPPEIVAVRQGRERRVAGGNYLFVDRWAAEVGVIIHLERIAGRTIDPIPAKRGCRLRQVSCREDWMADPAAVQFEARGRRPWAIIKIR